MEAYRTEEEQLEVLKKWWRDNGQATVIGIALALALVFGWQAWGRHQQQRLEDASMLYQSLLEADRASAADEAQLATARHLAEQLKNDYSGLTYGVFGGLYKAKYDVNGGDLASAEAELRWVLQQDPEAQLKLQAQVRLAHVLLAQKRYEDAQQVLAGGEMGEYAALIAELRGDIHLAKGEKTEALSAYQQARAALAQLESAGRNALLDMKIRDLEGATATADKVGDSAAATESSAAESAQPAAAAEASAE